MRVIKQAAAKWESIAIRLHFESHEISCIKKDTHYQSIDACRILFNQWLQGNGRTPITWNTVIKALEEADLSKLAGDLKIVLGVIQFSTNDCNIKVSLHC